jgi:hypothetical protein
MCSPAIWHGRTIGPRAPTAIRIVHHKTGATIWHPLEEQTDEGTVQFYADAEAVLARVPRGGVPMILNASLTDRRFPMPRKRQQSSFGGYANSANSLTRLVRCVPPWWHDGTRGSRADRRTGKGRALSGHRTQTAYAGYAKRTLTRALPATRKRHAHMLASANASGTAIQNEERNCIQNEGGGDDIAIV